MLPLTKEQSAAVRASGPLTVVNACPGSGKTTTLVARLQALLDDGADPQEIIVTTYTNAGVAAIRKKLPGINFYHLGTLHSLCWRVIQHYHRQNTLVAPTIIPQEQVDGLLDQAAKRVAFKGSMAKVIELMQTWRPTPNQGRLSPAQLVISAYLMDCGQSGFYDYDTILHSALRYISKAHALGTPMAAFPDCPNDIAFHHLLVDEAQDAAKIDNEIFWRLPVHRRFVVGDAMQSIFGFRGAHPSSIQDWARADGAFILKLSLNYRCASAIAVCANRLSVVARCPEMGWQDPGGMVRVSRQPNVAAVTADVVDSLTRYAGSVVAGEKAILCRTRAQVAHYRAALQAQGIQVRMPAERLRDQDAAQIRLWLAIAANPDAANLVVLYLDKYAQEHAGQLHRRLQQARADNVPAAVALQMMPENAPNTPVASLVHAQVAVPVPLALKRLLSGPLVGTVGHLPPGQALCELQRADLNVDIGMPGGVEVMTVHAAKGLEWDVVIVPEFNTGVWPMGNNVEEERRLAYVAITRARQQVHLIWSATWVPPWGPPIPKQAKVCIYAEEMGLTAPGDGGTVCV